MNIIDDLLPFNKYDTIKVFFRNSVISIPIITFIIGISFKNYTLILLTIGLVISEILNQIIKKFLKLFKTDMFLRPHNAKGCGPCCNNKMANNKIGFPSGHSQFIWFFSTYLFIYYYKKYNSFNTLPILILFALSISLSRLGIIHQLGNACHTPIQVISGSIFGVILSYYYIQLLISYKCF